MDDELADVRRRVEQQRTERLLRQAADAGAALEQDPADPVGRGSLGEAVTALLEEFDGQPRVDDETRDRLVAAREAFLTPTPPPLPIRSGRVVLRAPTMDDVDALHAFHGRDDVALYQLEEARSRDEMLLAVQRRTGRGPEGRRADVLPLVVEWDRQCVGDVALFLKGPSYSVAEIGWSINPEYGGRGLATDAAAGLLRVAFEHYRVHRVYAELDARNERSAALCERLGMVLETRERRGYWSKGEWTDSLVYAILRDDRRVGTC